MKTICELQVAISTPIPPLEPDHTPWRRSRLPQFQIFIINKTLFPIIDLKFAWQFGQIFSPGLESERGLRQNGHFINGPPLLIQKLSYQQEPALYGVRV